MKNRLTKVLALIGACALTVGCMTGCGNSNNTQSSAESSVESSTVKDTVVENSAAGSSETESSAADSDTELTGSITMIGSTSMEKLANALAETFMKRSRTVQ